MMNKPSHLISIFIAAVLATGCAKHDHAEHDHTGHEKHEHEAHDHQHEQAKEHKHAGSEIVLETEAATRFGVSTDTASLAPFHEAIKASGIVIPAASGTATVAAPKAGTVRLGRTTLGTNISAGGTVATIDSHTVTGGDPNAAADAALQTAKSEFERIGELYESRLVTADQYYAAKAAYEQAKAAYSPAAVSGRATSPISGIITALSVTEGEYVEAGAPIATVASARTVTLKVDVPRKYMNAADAADNLIVKTPYTDEAIDIKAAGGRRTAAEAMPSVSGASAYIPVYFTVPNNEKLAPGTTFTAYLTGSQRQNVLTLPVKALSEQQGQYYVYERLDDECYAKHLVRIGNSDGIRTEILSGINPGMVIVIDGVTTVRLAEAGAAIPEGHTHNH